MSSTKYQQPPPPHCKTESTNSIYMRKGTRPLLAIPAKSNSAPLSKHRRSADQGTSLGKLSCLDFFFYFYLLTFFPFFPLLFSFLLTFPPSIYFYAQTRSAWRLVLLFYFFFLKLHLFLILALLYLSTVTWTHDSSFLKFVRKSSNLYSGIFLLIPSICQVSSHVSVKYSLPKGWLICIFFLYLKKW